MSNRSLFGIFALVASLAAAAAQASEDLRFSRGDALVTSSIGEPSNLIPYLASDSASASISALLFNGLVRYDENLKLEGDLAETWQISADGLTIVFHLRKNVRWHDGKLFTARDVVFTFERLRDPVTGSPYAGHFEKVATCRALDEYTVEVVYREPFSPGLASWGMGIVPEHLLKDGDSLQFSRKPVGTGPFRLRQWQSGQSLILEAHRAYYEGSPHLDRYAYRIIPDSTVSFWELMTGALDLSSLTPLQFSRQTQSPDFQRRFQKFRYPSFGYSYLAYNLKSELFADVRVRRAIGALIDRQQIITAVLMGLGHSSTGPYLPDSWAEDPDLGAPAHDPVGARRLLAEAGWKDTDGDGFIDRGGKRFKFTVFTNQGNDDRLKTCQLIQSDLRKAGIEMEIRVLEWSVLLKEFIGKRRFEAVLLGWNTARDPDLYDIFHSVNTKPGGFNFVGYENFEADALLEEGRRTFGETQRASIYKRLHRRIREDEPYSFLFVADALVAVDRRFEGVRLEKTGIGDNLIEWFVEPTRQRHRFSA